MSLPTYFYNQDAQEAVKGVDDTHVQRVKQALHEYHLFLRSELNQNPFTEIANNICDFQFGEGFSEDDRAILKAREPYYINATSLRVKRDSLGKILFVNNRTISRFLFGDREGRPYKPSDGIIAVIRDFLIWRGILEPLDLKKPIGYTDAVYRLIKEFDPGDGLAFPQNAYNSSGVLQFLPIDQSSNTQFILLFHLHAGAYKFWSRVLTKKKRKKEVNFLGWYFATGGIDIGSIQTNEDFCSTMPFKIVPIENSKSFDFIYAKNTNEVGVSTDPTDPKFLFENMCLVENFEIKPQKLYTGRTKKNIPGGSRYAPARELGESVYEGKSPKELGKELTSLLSREKQHVMENLTFLEDDSDNDASYDILKAGANLDTRCEVFGWYPLHFFMKWHMADHMAVVFERDNVDYLVKNDQGLYPHQMTLNDLEYMDEEDIELLALATAKAREQARREGLNEVEIFGYSSSPPEPFTPGF